MAKDTADNRDNKEGTMSRAQINSEVMGMDVAMAMDVATAMVAAERGMATVDTMGTITTTGSYQ